MKPQKRTIEAMIRKAARLWGLEKWTFTWKYADLGWEGQIDPTHWTEQRAEVTIDRHTAETVDRKFLYRIIVHELGHCILYPVDRQLSDWTDHYGPKMDTKTRKVFDDNMNSAENIVLDHLICKVFKL